MKVFLCVFIFGLMINVSRARAQRPLFTTPNMARLFGQDLKQPGNPDNLKPAVIFRGQSDSSSGLSAAHDKTDLPEGNGNEEPPLNVVNPKVKRKRQPLVSKKKVLKMSLTSESPDTNSRSVIPDVDPVQQNITKLMTRLQTRLKTLNDTLLENDLSPPGDNMPSEMLKLKHQVVQIDRTIHSHTYTAGKRTRFTDRKYATTLDSDFIEDPAGMAFSRRHPSVLYVVNRHQGHTDDNLYVFNVTTGNLITFLAVRGATNYGWEALAVAPCFTGKRLSCIYVGDLSGRLNGGPYNIIYLIREPRRVAKKRSVAVYRRIKLKGFKLSSFAMMVSPDASIYIMTYEQSGYNDEDVEERLFRIVHGRPMLQCNSYLPSSWHGPDDAAISSSGTMVLLKTLDSVFFIHVPDGNYSRVCKCLEIIHLSYTMENDDYDERTNAIAFSPDELSYYTLGPGEYSPLYRYDRMKVSEVNSASKPTAQEPPNLTSPLLQ